MMWAVCCLAFFRFLRSSEFTLPSQGEEIHLSPSDLVVDKAHPHFLRVTIKQSKTYPFCQGVTLPGKNRTLHLPSDHHPFIRGSQVGPLFVLRDGRMLTRKLFSTFLDNILATPQWWEL